MFSPKKILVATDFSSASDSALREAIDIAGRFNSQIHLLHVIENIEQCAVDYCISESEILAEKNMLLEETRKRMKDEISRTVQNKSVPYFTEVRFGRTVDTIVDYERDNNIDLVITAPHSSRKHKGFMYHHITNELVKKSLCETMVVK
jgi:universal stress protein A